MFINIWPNLGVCLWFRLLEIAAQESGVRCRFKRATDEGSLPEIAQYSPYYLPLNVLTASKGSNLYILFQATLPILNTKYLKFVSEKRWKNVCDLSCLM